MTSWISAGRRSLLRSFSWGSGSSPLAIMVIVAGSVRSARQMPIKVKNNEIWKQHFLNRFSLRVWGETMFAAKTIPPWTRTWRDWLIPTRAFSAWFLPGPVVACPFSVSSWSCTRHWTPLPARPMHTSSLLACKLLLHRLHRHSLYTVEREEKYYPTGWLGWARWWPVQTTGYVEYWWANRDRVSPKANRWKWKRES